MGWKQEFPPLEKALMWFWESLLLVNTRKWKEFVNKKVQFSGKTMTFQMMQ